MPISGQWPAEGPEAASSSSYSSRVIRPARRSSVYSQRSVPTPISLPRKTPGVAGPPVSMIAGTSALAAPSSCAGTVLSQPAISTTASSGWARIDSSTSIAIRLR